MAGAGIGTAVAAGCLGRVLVRSEEQSLLRAIQLSMLAALALICALRAVRPVSLLGSRIVAGLALTGATALVAYRNLDLLRSPSLTGYLVVSASAVVGCLVLIASMLSIPAWFEGHQRKVAVSLPLAAVLGVLGAMLLATPDWNSAPAADLTRRVDASPPPQYPASITDGVGPVDSAAFGSGLLGISFRSVAQLVDSRGHLERFWPSLAELRKIGHSGHIVYAGLDDFEDPRFTSLSGQLLAFDNTSILEINDEGKPRRVLATLRRDRSKPSLLLLEKSRSALLPGTSISAVAPGPNDSLYVLVEDGLFSIRFQDGKMPVVSEQIDKQSLMRAGVKFDERAATIAMNGPDHVAVGFECQVIQFSLRNPRNYRVVATVNAGETCPGDVALTSDNSGRAWMLSVDGSVVLPLAVGAGEEPTLLSNSNDNAHSALAFDEKGSLLTLSERGVYLTGKPSKGFSL
jgi:hypothetical protein